MIPLTSKFSYFCTLPIAEEDLQQYLNDPIAAISPAIVAALPQIGIILAPVSGKGQRQGRRRGRPSSARRNPATFPARAAIWTT